MCSHSPPTLGRPSKRRRASPWAFLRAFGRTHDPCTVSSRRGWDAFRTSSVPAPAKPADVHAWFQRSWQQQKQQYFSLALLIHIHIYISRFCWLFYCYTYTSAKKKKKHYIRQLWVPPIEWFILNFASCMIHNTRLVYIPLVMACMWCDIRYFVSVDAKGRPHFVPPRESWAKCNIINYQTRNIQRWAWAAPIT